MDCSTNRSPVRVSLNLIKGVVFGLTSGALMPATSSQVNISRETGSIMSRTFPYLIFGIMMASSLYLVIKGVFGKNNEYVEFSRENAKAWGVPMAFLAITTGYVILLRNVGFITSSVIDINAVLAFLRCKKWHYYLICNVMILIVYYVFTGLIRVKLPGFPF